jgi:hypothetical protein
MRTKTILAALAVIVTACGGGSGDDQRGGSTSGPPPTNANIPLLFMGNSHTSSNNLTAMVADMVRAGKPGQTVASVEAPGWMFLEERVHDAPSLDLPALPQYPVSASVQQTLRGVAAETVQTAPPRMWCPGDAF